MISYSDSPDNNNASSGQQEVEEGDDEAPTAD
jgi:hypothetical protein